MSIARTVWGAWYISESFYTPGTSGGGGVKDTTSGPSAVRISSTSEIRPTTQVAGPIRYDRAALFLSNRRSTKLSHSLSFGYQMYLRHCQPRPSGGKSSGACTSGEECASGSCVNHVCSLVRSNPQKTCLTDKDCKSGSCSAGRCSKTLQSLDRGKLSFRQYCSQDSECPSGRKCVLNKCVQPKLPVGSACTAWGECKSGLCIMGKCQASGPSQTSK